MKRTCNEQNHWIHVTSADPSDDCDAPARTPRAVGASGRVQRSEPAGVAAIYAAKKFKRTFV